MVKIRTDIYLCRAWVYHLMWNIICRYVSMHVYIRINKNMHYINVLYTSFQICYFSKTWQNCTWQRTIQMHVNCMHKTCITQIVLHNPFIWCTCWLTTLGRLVAVHIGDEKQRSLCKYFFIILFTDGTEPVHMTNLVGLLATYQWNYKYGSIIPCQAGISCVHHKDNS